jgi:hypothetical protein
VLAAGTGWAQADVDTSATNLLAVLRESPGSNRADESLEPVGKVRAQLRDGREVEIDTSWFHYLGDMHVRLVFDSDSALHTASPGDLVRLRLSPEQAIHRAVDNLRQRYGEPQVLPLAGGMMQVLGAEADFASSYFLDRAFWEKVSREHPHGVVASVPQRGGLLFVPAHDAVALMNLQFSAAALFASADRTRVSSALYLFRDGRWSVFQAPQQVAAN